MFGIIILSYCEECHYCNNTVKYCDIILGPYHPYQELDEKMNIAHVGTVNMELQPATGYLNLV